MRALITWTISLLTRFWGAKRGANDHRLQATRGDVQPSSLWPDPISGQLPDQAISWRSHSPGIGACEKRAKTMIPCSQRQPHHRACGIRAADLGEARSGEHRHGPGKKTRTRHPGSLESGYIDRMPLDGRRTVIAGESDGSAQQRSSHAGSPMPTIDDKAGHPPDSGIVRREHLRQSPVPAHTGKRTTRPYPGPPDRMTIDIGNEPRRYRSVRHLPMQRPTVVRSRAGSRGLWRVRAEEELAPAPRRISATPTEHGDDIAPPVSSRGLHLYGHGPTIGACSFVLEDAEK
jgi:hypothetical protein